jgi:hypothetical protein
VLVVGGAFAASEGLRKKALDALFGAEEEFEYTSATTPPATPTPAPARSIAHDVVGDGGARVEHDVRHGRPAVTRVALSG